MTCLDVKVTNRPAGNCSGGSDQGGKQTERPEHVSGGIKGSHLRRVARAPVNAVVADAQTSALAALEAVAVRAFSMRDGLVHGQPSRAVSENEGIRGPLVFAVRPDGLDHEVESIGAVDFPEHAIVLAKRDDLGFGEVVQAVRDSQLLPRVKSQAEGEHSIFPTLTCGGS